MVLALPNIFSHPISSGSFGTKNPGYATCTQVERVYCHWFHCRMRVSSMAGILFTISTID